MMKRENFNIGQMPVSLYGEAAQRAFVFVHGLCGSAEEGLRFAEIVAPHGWQVLAVNLPEHGGRADGVRLLPWTAIPELQAVLNYAQARWTQLAVRATSIGAWFSLHAFGGAKLEMCLLNSPLTDMENMIRGMMGQAGVTEDQQQGRSRPRPDSCFPGNIFAGCAGIRCSRSAKIRAYSMPAAMR